MTSLQNNKAASIFSTLTAAAAIALGATGCVFTGGATIDTDPVVVDRTPDTTDPYVDPQPDTTDPYVEPEPVIAEITIDAGATMTADPGYGTGVFVQYDAGGYWTVFTTCDLAISGASCQFDVLISAHESVYIDNVEGFDLNEGDAITLGDDGSINLVTETALGMNGLIFDADPGAPIRLDVLIDGVAQPEFVFVVSDGQLLSGVPTNPVDFFPSTP